MEDGNGEEAHRRKTGQEGEKGKQRLLHATSSTIESQGIATLRGKSSVEDRRKRKGQRTSIRESALITKSGLKETGGQC